MDQKVHLLILDGLEQEMCGECEELSGSEEVMDAARTFHLLSKANASNNQCKWSEVKFAYVLICMLSIFLYSI